ARPRARARPPHAAGHRRLRGPRLRLVRARARRLGRAVRTRASHRPLPAEPRGRPRVGASVLAEAAPLPPALLCEPSAGGRPAVDPRGGAGALAGSPPRRPSRPAPALPSLLGRRPGGGVHAGGVEAPLLPAAVPAPARAARRARRPLA